MTALSPVTRQPPRFQSWLCLLHGGEWASHYPFLGLFPLQKACHRTIGNCIDFAKILSGLSWVNTVGQEQTVCTHELCSPSASLGSCWNSGPSPWWWPLSLVQLSHVTSSQYPCIWTTSVSLLDLLQRQRDSDPCPNSLPQCVSSSGQGA